MSNKLEMRRRWLVVVFLALALGMLAAGQTILRDRLGKVCFVIFWLACFVFTFLAIIIAALDAATLRRRARAEQREFLEKMLQEIARKKAPKPEGSIESKNDPP